MGIGPVPAIRLLLARSGMKLADIARIEVNEAQGAQTIAVQRELDLDRSVSTSTVGRSLSAIRSPRPVSV